MKRLNTATLGYLWAMSLLIAMSLATKIDYTQAGNLWRILSEDEKNRIAGAIASFCFRTL